MKDLRDPKFWASVSAWMVVVSIIVLWPIGIFNSWTISEIGTIIGAVAGPFAGLAGFLYIYVNFIEQQKQFTQQQDQFEKQTFETVFFNLITLFKNMMLNNFPPNGKPGIERLINFEQNLKPQSKYTGDNSKNSQIIDERRRAFMGAFVNLESNIQAFIQSIYAICAHVDNNRSIIDEKYYLETLYHQLDKTEINLLFYGYITGQGKYLPNEQYNRVLKEFLSTIEKFKLYTPSDIDLLENFSKPDPNLERE